VRPLVWCSRPRNLDGNEFGYPAGTRIGYATYVTSAVVDSNRERPRG